MKNIQIEIKWAIIFIAMTLLWLLLEKLGGFHSTRIDQHAIVTNFIAIPATLIFVFALLDKRKNFYEGKMTYIQGLVAGLIISVIIALFTPLTQYIISTVITPEYFPNAIEYAISAKAMTQEQAENYFNLSNYMLQGSIGALIMGALTSAIVAIFVRKS